jgi:glutamate/leucine/phenylalanine/valine dehydrogenase
MSLCGPTLAACAWHSDVSTEEAVRLARAMTFKNAARLPHGGGKSVIFADPRHRHVAQELRQWLTDALRPTHDTGSRQVVARSNRLSASLTTRPRPMIAIRRFIRPLHTSLIYISGAQCSLTQVNGINPTPDWTRRHAEDSGLSATP